jgi:hypothetical protein
LNFQSRSKILAAELEDEKTCALICRRATYGYLDKLMNETHTRRHLRLARATPLASIFGSGFLVIVPILNGAVGPYAVVAMAAVCAVAYAMGEVIRFNIRHAEPLLEENAVSSRVARYERTANLALVRALRYTTGTPTTPARCNCRNYLSRICGQF